VSIIPLDARRRSPAQVRSPAPFPAVAPVPRVPEAHECARLHRVLNRHEQQHGSEAAETILGVSHALASLNLSALAARDLPLSSAARGDPPVVTFVRMTDHCARPVEQPRHRWNARERGAVSAPHGRCDSDNLFSNDHETS